MNTEVLTQLMVASGYPVTRATDYSVVYGQRLQGTGRPAQAGRPYPGVVALVDPSVRDHVRDSRDGSIGRHAPLLLAGHPSDADLAAVIDTVIKESGRPAVACPTPLILALVKRTRAARMINNVAMPRHGQATGPGQLWTIAYDRGTYTARALPAAQSWRQDVRGATESYLDLLCQCARTSSSWDLAHAAVWSTWTEGTPAHAFLYLRWVQEHV